MNEHDEGAPELPPMHEGVLSDGALADYIRDLGVCAQGLEVRAKSAGRAMSSDDPLTLDAAVDALRSGGVRGVQLRYRFEGVVWCDTLAKTADGIRLMRIEIPAG